MGHSQTEKKATRERILAAAAAQLRARGLDGVGVAELMKEAGLTHGGFYRHFANRDELVACSLEKALAEGGARLEASVASSATPLTELANMYLSQAHRDNGADGCAVAALAPDVARGSPELRRAFTRQVARNTDLLQRVALAERGTAGRAEALNTLSLMAGALVLSRAVDDPALSQEILAAAKAAITTGSATAPTLPPRRRAPPRPPRT
jgi:TetR/AcrR family transcriptional repressor of nem operon